MEASKSTSLYAQPGLYATYLLLGFENIATEDVAGAIPGNVTEDLQVLGIVGHIKYPVGTVQLYVYIYICVCARTHLIENKLLCYYVRGESS